MLRPIRLPHRAERRLRPWWQQLIIVATMLALVYAFACTAATARLLTPNRVVPEVGALADTPREDVVFPAADDGVILRGWFMGAAGSDRLIIFVHGIDANRVGGRSAPFAPLERDLVRAGFNILAFDLRGHGASDGRWTTLGAVETRDVQGALAFAHSRGFQPDHIGILGSSMGGASSLRALGGTDVRALVTDSTFADLTSVIDRAFPLPRFMLPGVKLAGRIFWGVDVNAVRPVDSIHQFEGRHVLLIHGAQDAFVTPDHMARLRDAGGANVDDSWIVPGANHTQAYRVAPDEYLARVTAFFDQTLR